MKVNADLEMRNRNEILRETEANAGAESTSKREPAEDT